MHEHVPGLLTDLRNQMSLFLFFRVQRQSIPYNYCLIVLFYGTLFRTYSTIKEAKLMWPYLYSMLMSRGIKSLPVFEMPNAIVVGPPLKPRSLWANVMNVQKPLEFTGKQLAHAIIKADHLNYRSPLLPGLAFIIQSHDIIDWASGSLCLKAGAPEC